MVEDEISGGSDLQAMYHTLEEVPDASPQLYGGNNRARARTSTKELIKKHLEALALYPEAELEVALADEEDGASVNQDSDGESDMSISANGEVEGPAPVEIDEDEQEDLIVWSKRYKQALMGAKVHDTAMQTSKLGGKEVLGAAKAKASTGTLGSAVLKWKVIQPMVEALDMRPHMRDLVTNYAFVAAHEAGAQVLVPKGLKLKELSLSQLMAERAVLEAGELKKPAKVEEALAKMRSEQRQAQCSGKGSRKITRAV